MGCALGSSTTAHLFHSRSAGLIAFVLGSVSLLVRVAHEGTSVHCSPGQSAQSMPSNKEAAEHDKLLRCVRRTHG